MLSEATALLCSSKNRQHIGCGPKPVKSPRIRRKGATPRHCSERFRFVGGRQGKKRSTTRVSCPVSCAGLVRATAVTDSVSINHRTPFRRVSDEGSCVGPASTDGDLLKTLPST